MNCLMNSRTSRCRAVSGGSIIHLLINTYLPYACMVGQGVAEEKSICRWVNGSIGNRSGEQLAAGSGQRTGSVDWSTGQRVDWERRGEENSWQGAAGSWRRQDAKRRAPSGKRKGQRA